ncbi:hypothetical protein Ae406Ps2_3256c [Pseudonocardia sp. Ae406_Ps2]|nr:hypothetical protein Ae331Ps2_2671 [Pseudonocardia sp. Ae331_Ps2]OLM03256.1 hypothetical protein Ae406Ps2_3256c [Pseudonocardia sp. Ae406_Ps2]OLM11871.1 hypothetical protein Ae505Ps2_1997 [Pseudonocardia sp. Ae505_Ps2]OLM24815.1 hypothetical protein Ae706Ps2_3248c [Pseudonocardia sp. Ae706_Ps2]
MTIAGGGQDRNPLSSPARGPMGRCGVGPPGRRPTGLGDAGQERVSTLRR